MKISRRNRAGRKGTSLIEVVIAVGVLAVAVPLVLGTMAQSGEANASSLAETRCSWMVPLCMDELKLAMKGRSEVIPELKPGQDFPSSGHLVLGFSGEGSLLGKVAGSDYETGVSKLAENPVRYLATMKGEMPGNIEDGIPASLAVTIAVEYPAAAPAAKRQRIEFHTKLP